MTQYLRDLFPYTLISIYHLLRLLQHDAHWAEKSTIRTTNSDFVPRVGFMFSEQIGNRTLKELRKFLQTESIHGEHASDDAAEIFSNACLKSLSAVACEIS
jgi:hypothetical protein